MPCRLWSPPECRWRRGPTCPRFCRTRRDTEITMAKFTYDHIHLRSPNPEATAAYYERMFGAEVLRSMQQGKPRIDLKLGGVNIFIAPVVAGEGVNPPPATPYQ